MSFLSRDEKTAIQRFVPSVSLANGFFNRLFLSFVFFSLPFLSLHRHYTECCTVPRRHPSDNAITPGSICLRVSHLSYTLHRIASLSAAGATPEEPRDEERTWKPATLLQSHSSPELPVSPDESFASSCSLRNARNGRQLSANRCSLPDSSSATVSGLPERTVVTGYRGRGRKYERSRSEVTLLSSVELCGEFRGIRQMQRGLTERRPTSGWRAEETRSNPAIKVHENSLSSEISKHVTLLSRPKLSSF